VLESGAETRHVPRREEATAMTDVREALRRELRAWGHRVASDTIATRGELYIMGDRDLAAALFEFKRDVREAMDTMYQGSWVEGMPPRFAVMPVTVNDDPWLEVLEQARIIPLLYEVAGEDVTFIDLDAALEHLR
jgi:hypothetical protein